jgi:hypothetical protein
MACSALLAKQDSRSLDSPAIESNRQGRIPRPGMKIFLRWPETGGLKAADGGQVLAGEDAIDHGLLFFYDGGNFMDGGPWVTDFHIERTAVGRADGRVMDGHAVV